MLLVPTLVVALASAQSLPPWMTGESRPEELRISLVTFSPGDSLTEWWGHTALVVEDTRLNRSSLYNYGMFSFEAGFVTRFMKGRLEFWVSDDPVMGTFNLYRYLNRDVRIQELDLRPEEALEIAKALGTNVLPQNRVYLYHHYNDNCSTRPRDILDHAIGGQLKAATRKPASMSLRLLTRRYSQVSPPMSLVLDDLQNDELDRPITQQEEAFLPDELEAQVQRLSVTRADGTTTPLVKRQWNWFVAKDRAPVPAQPPNWIPQLFLVGLLLGGAGLLLNRWWTLKQARVARVLLGLFNFVLGLTWGALGVFSFLMGLLTDQTVTQRNENLFCASPITFAAFPLGVMLIFGAKRAPGGLKWTWTLLAITSVLGVVLKVVPVFNQDNWNIIALTLPVNVLFAASWWARERMGGRRQGT